MVLYEAIGDLTMGGETFEASGAHDAVA